MLSREPPVDLGPFPVGFAIPSLGFPLKRCQIRNPARAQTLPRVQAEFDLCLIEPTAVYRRVMHAEPTPDISTPLLAEVVGQRFAAVCIEVVHNQVDCVGIGVLFHDVLYCACELRAGTVGCGGSEVSPGFRLYGAKDIRRPAPFILVVSLGYLPWLGRDRRSHVGMQRNRFLIQANNGLGGIVGFLVDGQHVFHLLDVRLVQLSDAPHFFPATASDRGSAVKSGLSLDPPWEPTSV
jgi:hypothetical protein